MILATDLDGTFLGGTPQAREALYETLHGIPEAAVIFVTGRGLPAVLPLLDDPAIPDPDYIIADVGSTVVDGRTLEPIAAIQDLIEAAWPGDERAREALDGFEVLRPQQVPQARRRSYHLAGGQVPEGVRHVIEEELKCDLLVSAGGQYLDVLPKGVSKGTTLLALLEEKGLAHGRVVVAGDTLNDLSLFGCELKGVVVGGSEPELRERVARIGGAAYLADGEGCAGILEGLTYHGLLPRRQDPGRGEGEPVAERRSRHRRRQVGHEPGHARARCAHAGDRGPRRESRL